MRDALAHDLRQCLGDAAVSTDDADRSAYAHDLWPRQLLATRARAPRPEGPGAVVWPRHRDDLVKLIAFARRHGVQLLPFGAGSGVVGATAQTREAVTVDMKRMRALHSLDLGRGRCEVDAGALGEHLENALRRKGATLGHFPSSIYCSTVGGWVATRSAGQCSGRYGKIEDMVLGVEGVLGTGEPFHACAPESEGLDPRALIVGSEGTFGFLTRATLRVWPVPTAFRGLAYTFRSLEDAFTAMRALYQSGLRPAVSRLYDPFDTYVFLQGNDKPLATRPAVAPTPATPSTFTGALLRWALDRPRPLNALLDLASEHVYTRSLLIIGFETTAAEDAEALVTQARKLCLSLGGRDEGEGPARRWLLRRHAVSYRMPPTFERGLWVDTMEVAAPWSKLSALHSRVRDALGQGGFVMAHFSHAYPDGCSIYFTFAGASPDDRDALATYDATWQRALAAAHEAGGTVAHHHGVGRLKRAAMGLEWGAGVRLLEGLRRAADPDQVLVRGALVPLSHEGYASRPEPPTEPLFDTLSRTVTVGLGHDAESLRALAAQHQLRFDPRGARTLADWLASHRALSTRHDDPVDHHVAGWQGRLPTGDAMGWLAAPRRAAGPDLLPLLVHDRRFGSLDTVTLRLAALDEPAPAYVAPCEAVTGALDPTLARWIDRAAGTLTAPP